VLGYFKNAGFLPVDLPQHFPEAEPHSNVEYLHVIFFQTHESIKALID